MFAGDVYLSKLQREISERFVNENVFEFFAATKTPTPSTTTTTSASNRKAMRASISTDKLPTQSSTALNNNQQNAVNRRTSSPPLGKSHSVGAVGGGVKRVPGKKPPVATAADKENQI